MNWRREVQFELQFKVRDVTRPASGGASEAISAANRVADFHRSHEQQSPGLREPPFAIEERSSSADAVAALPPAEHLPIAEQRPPKGPPRFREHLSEPARQHQLEQPSKYSTEVQAKIFGVHPIDDISPRYREQHHSTHAPRAADSGRVAEERDDHPGRLVETVQRRDQELRDLRLLQVQSEVSSAAAAAKDKRRLLVAPHNKI